MSSQTIKINASELKFTFIRASGPGGQNVNKVATAVQLRFDVKHSSSLSEEIRARLFTLAASKITRQGELIIKANRYRTQERNRRDALERLLALVQRSAITPKLRKKTRPTLASKQRRLTEKKIRGENKISRSNKWHHEE